MKTTSKLILLIGVLYAFIALISFLFGIICIVSAFENAKTFIEIAFLILLAILSFYFSFFFGKKKEVNLIANLAERSSR
jgi:hypothetical protein